MAHKKWTWMFWLAALLIAVTPACTDDETGGPNSGTNNTQQEPDAEVPENARLVHVNDGCSEAEPVCAVDLTFTSERELTVKLLDGDGAIVPNARIRFDLDAGDAAGTTLSAANIQTDENGLAEITVRGGDTPGVASVIASVPSETTVGPIEFVVGVSSKENASYRVSFNHNGGAVLGDIEVLLHPSDVSCADVVDGRAIEFDPNTPGGLTAEFVSGDRAAADGRLPIVTFPNLPNGQAYTVEARAYSRASGEVEAAFGCKDMNPAIESGRSVDVEVDLVDNLPRIAGVYDVTHQINIQDAICMPDGTGGFNGVLPEPVCIAIDLLGRLATDPASFLVGSGNGDTGLVGLLVDFLPDTGILGDLKDTINSFLMNNLANGVVRDAINGLFEDWIQDAPPWVANTTQVVGDIYKTLQDLKIEGIIRINQEPVPMFDSASGSVIGFLDADMQGNKPGEQVWDAVIIEWGLPCAPGAPASCSQRRFSADQVGTADGNIVEGSFTGSLVPLEEGGYGLAIDEHSLSLNFGVLLLGILENVILPSLFPDAQPPVTSFNDAFDELISLAFPGGDGCTSFGDTIAEAVGQSPGGTVANIGKNLCNQLVATASDAIRDLLVDNLTVSGNDNFLLSTPAEAPCHLIEPETYGAGWPGEPFPYSNKMGTAEMQCEWEVNIAIGESTQINADASFYGERDL